MVKRIGCMFGAAYLLAGGFSAPHAAIPATERTALIALYAGTNGDSWWNNTGWKTPPLDGDGFALPGTECSWYSVWCDVAETTVQAIDLQSNLVSGSIPPEIGNLGGLVYLYLNNNQLLDAPPRNSRVSPIFSIFRSTAMA